MVRSISPEWSLWHIPKNGLRRWFVKNLFTYSVNSCLIAYRNIRSTICLTLKNLYLIKYRLYYPWIRENFINYWWNYFIASWKVRKIVVEHNVRSKRDILLNFTRCFFKTIPRLDYLENKIFLWIVKIREKFFFYIF